MRQQCGRRSERRAIHPLHRVSQDGQGAAPTGLDRVTQPVHRGGIRQHGARGNQVHREHGADRPAPVALRAEDGRQSFRSDRRDDRRRDQSARARIYVGEYGCTVGAPGSGDAANRTYCFTADASSAFTWGARLWFAWAYSSNGGYDSYDLVFGPSGPLTGCLTGSCVGLDSPHGWGTVNNGLPYSNDPVIQGIHTQWYEHITCP